MPDRLTAFADACVVGAMKRNVLLTLAEAGFFRLCWSEQVLYETERAIGALLSTKGAADPLGHARRARSSMQRAFEEAMVADFGAFASACPALPDEGDRHVVAAAMKARASTIVTDNLRHFPRSALSPLGLEARSADGFVADVIALDPTRAAAAVATMRARLKRPEKTPERLLRDMAMAGLAETAALLGQFAAVL